MSPRWRRALLKRLPRLVVWRVGDPDCPTQESPDPAILEWCEKEDFLLLTNNRASMPLHLKAHVAIGRHVPGIVFIDESVSMGENMARLELLIGASFPGEWQNRIIRLAEL